MQKDFYYKFGDFKNNYCFTFLKKLDYFKNLHIIALLFIKFKNNYFIPINKYGV